MNSAYNKSHHHTGRWLFSYVLVCRRRIRPTRAASNSGMDAAPPTSGQAQTLTASARKQQQETRLCPLARAQPLPIRPTDTQQASDALQDPRGHMRASVAQCRTPRFEPDGYYLINPARLITAISTNGG